MTTKKGLISVMFSLALVFLLVVTYAKLAFAQKEPQILKIGSHNPRTGPAAAWGLNTDWAIDLCVDEWNKKGGVTVKGQKYKIEMIHEDDKARAEEAVKAVNKLIYTDKVKFIAGPMSSTAILAAAPIIEANKIVTFVGGFSPAAIKDRKYFFRVAQPSNHISPAFFKFITGIRPDLKTSVHVAPNDATGWGQTQGDNDGLYAVGVKVLGSEFYDYGTQDFTSMLARIIPLKPDLLSMTGTPPGVLALIVKQARELGYKGVFTHCSVCNPPAFGAIAGWENIEGMITGDTISEGPGVPPALKKVYNDWIAKYGEQNASGFPNGIIQYDDINILCRAIEKANSLEPDKVRDAIENLGEVETIFGKGHWGGKETYNNNHQFFEPFLITQVQNKKLILLGLGKSWEVPPPEQKWR